MIDESRRGDRSVIGGADSFQIAWTIALKVETGTFHSAEGLVKHVVVLDVVIKIARGTKGIDINPCTQHILNCCAMVALWMIRTHGTEERVLSLRSEPVREPSRCVLPVRTSA